MSSLVLLLVCVLGATVVVAGGEGALRKTQSKEDSGQGESATCKYWCRRQGGAEVKYHCCDSEPGNAGKNNRVCPPERAICPQRGSSTAGAPNPCSSDRDCRGQDMCCQDVCLGHRTCKPSQPPSPDADKGPSGGRGNKGRH